MRDAMALAAQYRRVGQAIASLTGLTDTRAHAAVPWRIARTVHHRPLFDHPDRVRVRPFRAWPDHDKAEPHQAGGKQCMPVREYYPGAKPYRMVHLEDPFGNIIDIHSRSWALTRCAGAGQ